MGPKRNKKKVKLSKAQKAKLKKQAAELKAQQEEEARLQREKEERERKEREAKEREERQILEEQERARHQDKIDEFNQLLEENKKILLDFKRSKLKKQKWEKYMLCDGRPNTSSYKEMNMFISLLADDDDDVLNFKHVLEKCDLIVELVKECDKSAEDILLENSIVEEAGETTGLMSLQKYNEIKDALQSLIGLRIDVATKKNLEQPINAIDIETLNITIEDQSQHFKICLWGNTGKNPRVKQITFQNDKFTMELPKVMALSDVALRIIYLDLDIFSSKCCTFAKKLVLENKEGNPEVEKNTEGFCTKNTGNGAVDGEFTIVGNNGREKQSELSEDFQKNKVIKTEIEKENLLETIIDLRQYRPLGRIFIVDLLELPPQEKENKGWVMQQVISGKLKKFTYNKDENSNLSPSLTSIKMAYNSPLNLTICIDENVILHDTPQIAWWDSLTKHWTNEGISDVCYKKEENLLYFRTATLGPFAVMQEIYFNMPFQTWSVCPLALNMCVLKVVGAAIEVLITVKDDLCCASFPKDKQLLPHLNNHWVSSKELIEELRRAGVNIFPFEDGYKYVSVSQKDATMLKCLYQQMALSACSFSFSWSRWNSVCDEEKVVLQATEWLSSQPPKKSNYHLYLVTTRICCKLKGLEDEDEFSTEIFPETRMLPDLYHTLREKASDDARLRLKETSVLFIECVNELLSASNLLVYSGTLKI